MVVIIKKTKKLNGGSLKKPFGSLRRSRKLKPIKKISRKFKPQTYEGLQRNIIEREKKITKKEGHIDRMEKKLEGKELATNILRGNLNTKQEAKIKKTKQKYEKLKEKQTKMEKGNQIKSIKNNRKNQSRFRQSLGKLGLTKNDRIYNKYQKITKKLNKGVDAEKNKINTKYNRKKEKLTKKFTTYENKLKAKKARLKTREDRQRHKIQKLQNKENKYRKRTEKKMKEYENTIADYISGQSGFRKILGKLRLTSKDRRMNRLKKLSKKEGKTLGDLLKDENYKILELYATERRLEKVPFFSRSKKQYLKQQREILRDQKPGEQSKNTKSKNKERIAQIKKINEVIELYSGESNV